MPTPQRNDNQAAAERLRAAWDAHRKKVLYGIAAAVLLSTAASFYESFTGLVGWFERLGFHGFRAFAAPAMIDLVGLAGEAIALVVIIEGRGGIVVRVLAWFAFTWGLALSVVGNAGRDGFRPGAGGWFDMFWFAVPPLSLAILTSATLALVKILLKPAPADPEVSEDLTLALFHYGHLIAPGAGDLPGYRDIGKQLRIGSDPARGVLAELRALRDAMTERAAQLPDTPAVLPAAPPASAPRVHAVP